MSTNSKTLNPNEMTSPSGRKAAPVYMTLHDEMLIDVPVGILFRTILDFSKWQNYSILETVAGTPGVPGHVWLAQKNENSITFPVYYSRTIEIDENRRAIWKTFPQEPTDQFNFDGIVDYQFVAEGQRTRLIYNMIYEWIVPYEDEAELAVFREKQYAMFRAFFADTLPRMKEICRKEVEAA